MADELTKMGTGTLEKRKSFIAKGDVTGTEDITSKDFRLPRLAIAQGLSPQLVPDGTDYIKGLTLFDLFNDLTGQIYGRGPLKFVPVKREVRRIEFDPDNRGIPLDLNVPVGDPRCDWTDNPETGEREAPKATKFTEFVVLLVHDDGKTEPIVMSIKDTNKWNRKAADRLTGFIKVHPPIYSTYYTVSSKSEKNDEGTFGVYAVRQLMKLDDPDQTDEQWEKSLAIFQNAKQFREAIQGKDIVVNREGVNEDKGVDNDNFEIDEDGNVRE